MKFKLDKYSNDYRLAELKKEKNLFFGNDGYFYETRENEGIKESRRLQPDAEMKKFRRYSFDDVHIIIEIKRTCFRIAAVIKDEIETKSLFYFCVNDYRFIRIVKYQTIHKEAFETYLRGSGDLNYMFERQEMFYTAAGNQFLCKPQEYPWKQMEIPVEKAVEA